MGSLRDFLIDVGRNAYGLGENVASLGSAAIAEPVAGYAAMFDPVNGAAAIREGMTYQPRTEAGRMYQQGAAQAVGKAVKPVMPVVDTWQKGVDIAGRYSPTLGALMQTAPTALGVALGAKPTLQAGRQASNTLGAMQARMIANANAPRTLNTGFRGQRGAINPSDFNLITNPDGTVTLYHGTTNESAKKIIQDKKLLSAGEPDVYMTTDPMAGYGDGTVVQLNIDPKHLFLDDEFPSGRVDFRMPSVKGWRIQQPKIYEKGGNNKAMSQRPLTEFEQAHLIAQRNAALPVSQGGLGLAPDNTAMDRARALGFDVDTIYTHRSRNTPDYFQEINPKKDFGGIFSLANDDAGERYGKYKHEFLLKGDIASNIADEYSDSLLKKNFKEIVGHNSSKKISSDDMDMIRYVLDNQSVYIDNPDKLYELFNAFDDVEAFKSMQKTIGELSRRKGYGAVKMEDEFGDSTMLLHGNKVRYKNAAFDPMKKESSNLLAQFGALAPTATMAAYLYNQERNKGGKQ